MSKSFRTKKPSIIASEKIIRDNRGIVGLRIEERKPYQGDIHPIKKKELINILNIIPDEYLYGLKSIELSHRNNPIGSPFGEYRLSENSIFLYSLPTIWEMKSIGNNCKSSILSYGAEINHGKNNVTVKWNHKYGLSLWFFYWVFTHELGHHYRWQYSHRNGFSESTHHEEWLADIHSNRIKTHIRKILNDSTTT